MSPAGKRRGTINRGTINRGLTSTVHTYYVALYTNLTASIMRLHLLLNSASPCAITAIIALGFPGAIIALINGVITFYAVRLVYRTIFTL